MKPALQLSLLVACTLLAASPSWPDSEELNVRQTITDLAEAYMAFPETRNHHSVMKYFAPDYSFFDDAGPRSLHDVGRMLTDLEGDLARGPLVINEQITDIVVHLEDAIAWATYWNRVIIARHREITESLALCTAIFRKTPERWVYRHEHYSSNTLENGTDLDELTKLTRIFEHPAVEPPSAKTRHRVW